MAALSKLLPLHPVKYHTASATQRQLLKHAQLQVLQLKQFLSSSLLPAINSSKSSQTEPLLQQALDELSAVTGPAGTVEELDRIFVDSFLVPIDSCVDSTSELCRNLFGKQDSPRDFLLLPGAYTTPQRLAVLKRHGLGHEGTASPFFYLVCARQFAAQSSSMSRDASRKLSRQLVNMLLDKISMYLRRASRTSAPETIRQQIANCAVFTRAELQFPYSSSIQPPFVSLADSTDHDHYRLVALSMPITDTVHGSTKELRALLGLQTEPQLDSVIDHLLKTAAAGHIQTLSNQTSNPLLDILLQDDEQAYGRIVRSISEADPVSRSMLCNSDMLSFLQAIKYPIRCTRCSKTSQQSKNGSLTSSESPTCMMAPQQSDSSTATRSLPTQAWPDTLKVPSTTQMHIQTPCSRSLARKSMSTSW
ncbi:TPA: hypothetical protein ACH3X2_005211 [Trebouxia sp. C0005]